MESALQLNLDADLPNMQLDELGWNQESQLRDEPADATELEGETLFHPENNLSHADTFQER